MDNTPRALAIALGIALGEHAASLGLNQQQVAEKCGFAQGTVSRVFSGKYPAKSEVLCAIAEAIGVELKIETLNGSERGEKTEIMWYVFTNAGQAYNPTQTPEFDKNFGRWHEFDTLEEAESFRESYQ